MESSPSTPEKADTKPPQSIIRSFVLRTGRMTHGQRDSLTKARNTHEGLTQIPYNDLWPPTEAQQQWIEHLHLAIAKHGNKPLALDVGFGMGDGTIGLATQFPHRLWLAIDVHPPGVGRLLSLMKKAQINNIHVCEGDANTLLSQAIADSALSFCTSFFPDPWPKKRHHKRRLIQENFARLLAQKMKTGGLWHIATDWYEYALQMNDTLIALTDPHQKPLWQIIDPSDPDIARAIYRPPTKFAIRATKEGREINTMVLRRG